MKVGDATQTSAISVQDDLPVKNLARIINNAQISGFPVVHGKKLVGFVTEEDVFSNLYNIEDEKLRGEKAITQILEGPVKNIMVKDFVSVTPETNLLDAQVLMYRYNFTRLPVTNLKGELLGTVSRSNAFGQILKSELPKFEEGQYASFVLDNYDQMVDWEKRFEFEFPTLIRLFNRHKVSKILDVGVWTGEYSIGLAKEGLKVVGIDAHSSMIHFANSKKKKLSGTVAKRIEFIECDYNNIGKKFFENSFDAVICMGGSLPYFHSEPDEILRQFYKVVRKNGLVVLQLLNLERIIEKRRRFLFFKIKKAKKPATGEELYVEFFDVKNEKTLIHNVVNFTSEGGRWIYKGINSIEIKYIKNNDIIPMLKKAEFKDIIQTGIKGEYKGEFGQMSLVKPFDPKTSDWMTVIAKK